MATRYNAQQVVGRLRKEIERGRPLFMPNTGMGLSAKLQEKGGADLICVSATSYWRLKGQGSLAAFTPYYDCNQVMFDLAAEILPVVKETPVITLSGPHNPLLDHRQHIQKLMDLGYSGVSHLPFRLYESFIGQLDQIGMGFDCEIDFIRTAHEMDMFTFTFAATPQDAARFAEAGADVVSSHVGSTKGGEVGAATELTLDQAAQASQDIFDAARAVRDDVILFAHGGPMETPDEVAYVYEHTNAQGFIGGSAAERMPIEKAILAVTEKFKNIPFQSKD